MEDLAKLETIISEIMTLARASRLDFYPMRFEVCPPEVICTFGAYGMPTRFSHWSFGKAYARIKMHNDYGLNRIYEMVINTDPCYAFLLHNNSPLQSKLVVAHTLAHSDFFKHNAYFSNTARDMLEVMALAAERIQGYELLYGRECVEEFLTAVLAVQEHVEPHQRIVRPKATLDTVLHAPDGIVPLENPKNDPAGKVPALHEPEKDLLLFLAEHAPELTDWERDIILIVRKETLYFWPQLTTKILNEGWATYWHTRLLREMELEEDEAMEFAFTNALLMQPGKTGLNPYLTGFRMMEDIERRYGVEKLFEVRSVENDLSLFRNYLTEELVKELDLYVYRLVGQDWREVTREWEKVREVLLHGLVNGGNPYLVVADDNYKQRGELYIKHVFDERELDVYQLERALAHVFRLWRRPVHLETVLDGRQAVFRFTGQEVSKSSF
jgi:stage V sporulation protein R